MTTGEDTNEIVKKIGALIEVDINDTDISKDISKVRKKGIESVSLLAETRGDFHSTKFCSMKS